MDQGLWKGFLAGTACACAIGLAGCASPQPRDFHGAWHPINQFAVTPGRVELREPSVFRATPLDATLKGVLARWARDARLRVDYQLPYDLTLHQPVAKLRSERIEDALRQLDALFEPQQVAITLTGGTIIVAPRTDAAVAEVSAGAPGPGGREVAEPEAE